MNESEPEGGRRHSFLIVLAVQLVAHGCLHLRHEQLTVLGCYRDGRKSPRLAMTDHRKLGERSLIRHARFGQQPSHQSVRFYEFFLSSACNDMISPTDDVQETMDRNSDFATYKKHLDEAYGNIVRAEQAKRAEAESKLAQTESKLAQAESKLTQAEEHTELALQAVYAACTVLIAGGRYDQLPLLEHYLQKLTHARAFWRRHAQLPVVQATHACADPEQGGIEEGGHRFTRPVERNTGGHRRIARQRCHLCIPGTEEAKGAGTCCTCAGQMSMCDNEFRKHLVACWFQIGMACARNDLGQRNEHFSDSSVYCTQLGM